MRLNAFGELSEEEDALITELYAAEVQRKLARLSGQDWRELAEILVGHVAQLVGWEPEVIVDMVLGEEELDDVEMGREELRSELVQVWERSREVEDLQREVEGLEVTRKRLEGEVKEWQSGGEGPIVKDLREEVGRLKGHVRELVEERKRLMGEVKQLQSRCHDAEASVRKSAREAEKTRLAQVAAP